MSLRTTINSRLEKSITWCIDLFYLPFIERLIPRQIFRYMACGGGNLCIDLVLYAIMYNFVLKKQVLELGFVAMTPHIAAFVIVFPITFCTGFWLARHISFAGSKLQEKVQLFRYMLSVCGSILLNYVLLKFFVEIVGIYPTPSKALTTLLVILYSFIMQKYFTFKQG
ncbi:MAG: GtrA family protein [Rikenellaceae bacterium]